MAKKNGGVKEFIRKRLVALKRKPQMIAMVIMVIAFVYYSLNLTHFTMTTEYVNVSGMGLSGFVIMLFSVLALVCFLNAFPHRKPVNKPMLALLFLLCAAVFYCDFHYMQCVDQKFETVRSRPLVTLQEKVDTAKRDAEIASKSITRIRTNMNTAKNQQKTAESRQKDLIAALERTPAADNVKENAQKQAAEAVERANAAYKEAQAAFKQAQTDQKAAKAKAEEIEGLITAEEPTLKTYAEVMAAAQASLDASKKVVITSTASDSSTEGTVPVNAVDTSKTLADTATKARNDAEEALALVDPWKAVELQQKKIAALEATVNAMAKGQSTTAETAASQLPKVDLVHVQLPDSVIAEAYEMGEAAVEAEKQAHPELMAAKNILVTHCIILLAAVLLTALLPVYTPLLRKIKTSIEVEENENMGEIELDGSDE